MKRLPAPLIINFAGFQLLWAAAVLGGARDMSWPSWVVLGGMLAGQWWFDPRWIKNTSMLLWGLVLCLLLEPIWLSSGLLAYTGWDHPWLAPGWIWALWLGFAVSFHYSLRWLCGRPWLGAAFGAVGGIFSVTMGIRLGAASAPLDWLPIAMTYGVVWAVAVPLLAYGAQLTGEREHHHA